MAIINNPTIHIIERDSLITIDLIEYKGGPYFLRQTTYDPRRDTPTAHVETLVMLDSTLQALKDVLNKISTE